MDLETGALGLKGAGLGVTLLARIAANDPSAIFQTTFMILKGACWQRRIYLP